MRKQPREITKENVAALYRYLLAALNSQRRGLHFISGPIQRARALKTLQELSPDSAVFLQGVDVLAPDPEDLQAWIDRTLGSHGARRMWADLLQEEFKAQPREHRIGIKENLWYRLSVYADHEGLSLEGAIDKLLRSVIPTTQQI